MLIKKRSTLDTSFWSSVTPQHLLVYRRPVWQILSLIQPGRKSPVSHRAQSRLWSRQLWAVVSFWAGRLGWSSQALCPAGCQMWAGGEAYPQASSWTRVWWKISLRPKVKITSISAHYPTALRFTPRENLKGFREDRWNLCSAVYSKTASGYSLAEIFLYMEWVSQKIFQTEVSRRNLETNCS